MKTLNRFMIAAAIGFVLGYVIWCAGVYIDAYAVFKGD